MSARRLAGVVAGAGDALDRPVPPSGYTPRQIARHMANANEPYLLALDDLAKSLPQGDASNPVRRTFLGKFLEKAAGPGGNAPIPSRWVPPASAECGDPFTDLASQTELLDQYAKALVKKDLARATVRNPLIRFLTMTVDDVYLLLAAHTERHVGQIEQGTEGK
ncbi:MAG: DinB family protein [Fimbriimonadaceae bacterium]